MKRRFLFALAFALTLVLALCGAACSNEIKLTFETNGGTPAEEIVAEAGGEVTLPKTTKTGFAFDGWYTQKDFSGERYEGTVPSPEKSTKYYAKWVTGYEVKLETDGGSLTATSVWVKEGGSISEAVQGLVPQKSGLTFGAWFLGERELSASDRMPAETVTLTAKYKAEYIIQLYLQNLSRTSYQRADEYETVGSGYVNTAVSPAAPSVHGYSVQPNPEGRTPVTTLTLSVNAEENVYSFYYDRNEYGVFYDGNPPEGVTVTGSMPYDTVIFGGAVAARENGFSAEQYRFAGWAESADGDVVYEAGDTVTVRGGVTLYAVWDKGFTDRMGSEDLIFFPRTDSDVAVLLRNGMEFTGTREGNSFSFTTTAGETFTGSVVGGVFCYERKDLEGTYIYYDNYPRPLGEEYPEEERYDESRTLEVDASLGAYYTENGVRKHGSLAFSKDQGDYLFTSDDGTISFHTVFLNAEAQDKKIFSASGGEFGYYATTSGSGVVVMLDGYGTVFLQFMTEESGSSSLQGMYYIEGKGMAFEAYDSFKIVCFINDSTNFLGDGAGWRTFYLCVLPGYYSSIGEDYGLYYFADSARGTYENGNETLTVDGHGYYLDSAVYTDKDGKKISGGYRISVDYVTGTVIEIIDANDEVLGTFRIFSDGSFSPYDASKATAYTEYYLLEGESMKPTMLAVFEEEYEGKAGTKRAEVYTNNSKNVGVHAASGYVTSAPIKEGSDFLLYSFTRTWAEYGFGSTVPESMKFTVTSTSPNDNNTVWYDCYSVLEKNGVKNYKIIELPDGTVWVNTTVSVKGEGSVYFKDNGQVSHCSFPISTDEFFNETYGELLDSGTGGAGQLFKLTPSSGDIAYTAAPAVGLPTTFSYFDPALSPENGPFENLVLTPDGRACYDDDNNGEWKSVGTYRDSGKTTIFGSPIYELVFGESVRFEFVQGNLYFLGMTYPAYFRSAGMGEAGAYSTEGGTLTIDGFGRASYVAGSDSFSGSYYFMTDNILRISDAEGTQREFEIGSDNSFSALDDCYGTWDLVNGNFFPINNYSRIFFDGKGNYTITTNYGQGSTSQGRYELWDAEYGEYVIYQATLDGKKANYHVRFMDMAEYNNYNCVVQELAAGTYVNDEYTVLYLNGFGSGSLRGSRYESEGNFRLIDEIDGVGFGYMEFTTVGSSLEGELYHFLLDYEHGTFRILEETGYYTNIIYFASDLDHIAFRDDGAAFLGNLISGDYLIDGDKVRVYQESGPSYIVHEVPLYGGDTYVYTTTDDEGKPSDKTYYRYTGATFTADGKIEFLDAEGQKTEEKTATFSFDIRYRSIVGFAVTFKIDGENYAGFELYTYTSSKIDPRLEYNRIVYNIDFTRTSDGKWTFTVTDAGVRSFVRNDHNDIYADGPAQSGTVYHQGGKITFTYNGFGSYQREETVYDGNFLYFYDEKKEDRGELIFKGVKESEIRTVGYNDLGTSYGGYRELREIVFEQNGKTYAIDFFEHESGSFSSVTTYDFLLYGIYEYEEVEAGDYTLGVKYLLRTNLSGSPGYGNDDAIGKPVAVTLLSDEAVVAITVGARYGENGVWIVENDNGRAGEAYLVTFQYGEGEEAGKVLSGSVQKGEVQQVGLSQSYLFYMFVDEEGDLVEIAAAWYANTAFASVTEISHEGTVWTFTGREDASEPLRKYTLAFTKGGSGNYTVRVTSVVVEEEE